jgi:hypothetical protein
LRLYENKRYIFASSQVQYQKSLSAITGHWPFTQEKFFEVKVGPENRVLLSEKPSSETAGNLILFRLAPTQNKVTSIVIERGFKVLSQYLISE